LSTLGRLSGSHPCLCRRIADALAQRRHQVDDLARGSPFLLGRTDLVALELFVDQLLESRVVVVLELLRLKFAGLALDQLDGEIDTISLSGLSFGTSPKNCSGSRNSLA